MGLPRPQDHLLGTLHSLPPDDRATCSASSSKRCVSTICSKVCRGRGCLLCHVDQEHRQYGICQNQGLFRARGRQQKVVFIEAGLDSLSEAPLPRPPLLLPISQ